jgi:putative transposase
MPRRPRIPLNNGPLHIVQRGHNRAPCFFGEEDFQSCLIWLGGALKKEDGVLHAHALTTNHVHLLLTPALAEAVPRIVIALARRYGQNLSTSYTRGASSSRTD